MITCTQNLGGKCDGNRRYGDIHAGVGRWTILKLTITLIASSDQLYLNQNTRKYKLIF